MGMQQGEVTVKSRSFGKGKLARHLIAAAGLAAAIFSTPAFAQAPVGSSFTYQGKLTDSGSPINNACDFRFKLFDAATGGTQIGSTLALKNTTPANGLLTVSLDFGFSAFQGDGRFLEIEVRNRKDSAETIHVIERAWGQWSITKASAKQEKLDANTFQWVVTLKPREVRKITYTVETVW